MNYVWKYSFVILGNEGKFKDFVFCILTCAVIQTNDNVLFFSYRRLITDSKVKLKYQHLITNSFVEVSSRFFLFLLLVHSNNQ